MSKLRRRYTREEKLQIVNESMEENVTVKEIGMRYNIHPHTIHRWRKEFSEYAHNSFPGKGNKHLNLADLIQNQEGCKNLKFIKESL